MNAMNAMNTNIQTMKNWIFGYQISKAIFCAAELGIPDILESGPLSVDDLSTQTQTHKQALYRLLIALSSIGIFEEREDGIFAQTDLSRVLVKNQTHSLKASAQFYCGKQYDAWGRLMESVRTGDSVFPELYTKDFYSYMTDDEAYFDLFNQHVNHSAAFRIDNVLSAYDFSSAKTIIDVGSGCGNWLMALLKKYPDIKGILFDTPLQEAAFKKDMANQNNTIPFIAGDFFQEVPAGGDLYFLSNIIHQWPDEKVAIILRNCRKAMERDGKLILIERIILPKNTADYGKWMDLSMLVMLGGRERTQVELEQLLLSADFKLTQVVSTEVGLDIIEACPV